VQWPRVINISHSNIFFHKPIYVAQIPSSINDYRFQRFRKLFKELNIIRDLGSNIENWSYKPLDESNRTASEIKKKLF